MLTRRQLIARGAMATGAAAAWNWTRPRHAFAAGAPTRLIVLPLLNGAEARHFWPNPGNVSMVTEPLRAYQSQMTFVKGINVDGSNNHMAVRSIFTGAAIPDYLSPDPTNKSIDQIIADQIAASAPTKLRSLHLGVLPADSIEFYQRYGRSTFFFAPKPVDYEANPVSAFDRTFKGLSGPTTGGGGTTPPPTGGGGGTTTPAPPTDFERDVLDISDSELNDLGKRLAGMPRELAKVDQHRLAIKSLRSGLVSPAPGTNPSPNDPMPMPPSTPMGGKVMCDTSTLPSVEKLRAALAGKDKEAYKAQYFSDIFDAQVDIAVRALVCGVTRVATIQAGSADGNPTDPVGPGYPHHNTSHGTQDIFATCQQWYMSKFGRLIKGLDVPDPLDPSGKTVLYNSVILIMSECLPVSHGSDGVPVLIAGGGSGLLKQGQIIDAAGATNKALMATLLQVFGASSGGGHFGTTTIGGLRA